MARPGGIFKRPPMIEQQLQGRYAKLSKADWADAYADLYRQVFGEEASDTAVIEDAEKRNEILATYRKQNDAAQGYDHEGKDHLVGSW